MTISREKILQKMEQELAAAKKASPNEMERHVYAIKSICELMLGVEVKEYAAVPVQPSVQPPVPLQPQPQVVGQSERLPTEDGSNGDSIFDF